MKKQEFEVIISTPENNLPTTFEEALKLLPKKDKSIVKYNNLVKNGVDGCELALRKLIIITKALNNGWEPDWNNENQYKYFPYFDMRNGVSFASVGYAWIFTYSAVSSLLCVDTEGKAKYLGRYFIDLYRILLTDE